MVNRGLNRDSVTGALQRGTNGFITEKTILFQGSRGGRTFSRGVKLFPGGGGGGGGSKCLFL